jgi:hypothetical protein
MREARQLETASRINHWLSSSGVAPPNRNETGLPVLVWMGKVFLIIILTAIAALIAALVVAAFVL